MTITVNEERLAEASSTLIEQNGGELCWTDDEMLNNVIQHLLDQHVFDLPEGVEAVAYYFSDGDPGFIWALRPRSVNLDDPFWATSVASWFSEARHVEPRDEEMKSAWDNGNLDDRKAIVDVAETLAKAYEELLPAYRKLWE